MTESEVAPLDMCCGGTCVRALCFIHGTEPTPAREYEVEDSAVTHVRSACGQYVQTFRGGKLVDEEPVEAFAYSPAVIADALGVTRVAASNHPGIFRIPTGATSPGLAFANCRCVLHPIVKVDIS
jgi:hypothetical protein